MANQASIVSIHGSTEKEFLNAAITPWAGFIYPKLCDIHAALEKQQGDSNTDTYFPNFEGYDNFATLDKTDVFYLFINVRTSIVHRIIVQKVNAVK